MDLSHMVGLWLAGQSAGVEPGGVGVVYAPIAASLRDAETALPRNAEKQSGAGVYPFSAERWCLGGRSPGVASQSRGLAAGLGLIGELEYGPDGLSGFLPRLWTAVSLGLSETGLGHSDGESMETFGSAVNRGDSSIGLAESLQFVDRFDADGVLGRARVVGFVERAGQVVQTCADVATSSFPVMFGKLVDYLRFAVAAQVEGNGYEDLAQVLAQSDRPAHAVVIVGLSEHLESRMSDVGSIGHQAGAVPGAGDVCHSVVYDAGVVTLEEIEDALRAGDAGVLEREGVSWLRQVVA